MTKTSNDTIAALATPIGEGGIGIIKVSGPGALKIADKVFAAKNGRKPSLNKSRSVLYGHAVRKAAGKTKIDVIDEALLTIMRAPKSYTMEDVIELSCHGGIAALRQALEAVLEAGARLAQPGEFTKRAFMNGRIDLAQAEAVADIIRARTDASLRSAVSMLEGALSKEMSKERALLIRALSEVEALIDFNEEDIDARIIEKARGVLEKAVARLSHILDNADAGIMIREGITCVICGKPNVGKSSLLNAMLRMNRAIVTDIPGTTRDIIEETVTIGHVPVKVVDTAGITRTKDLVERKGIEKARAYIKKADIIIFMIDMSSPFDGRDRAILNSLPPERTMIVANKCDLPVQLDISAERELKGRKVIQISVSRRKNLALMEKEVANMAWEGKIAHPEASFLGNIRQKKALAQALRSVKAAMGHLTGEPALELASVDIRKAVSELGLVTGETVSPDILDRIFARFCIGK